MESIRFLRMRDVMAVTGLSRPSVYRFIKKGDFPQPVKLGELTSAWIESEIQEWCKKKIAGSRGEA